MDYFVYILYSEKLGKFYIGTTDDVQRRILEHNTARYKNAFTSRGMPWELYLSIPCSSSEQGYQLERLIKRMKSARFIKSLKDDPLILASIISKLGTEAASMISGMKKRRAKNP